MKQKLKLEFAILLPHVESERDQCVHRLAETLRAHKGIQEAHVDLSAGKTLLCLHYDADVVSMAMVPRLAERVGAAGTSIGTASERKYHGSSRRVSTLEWSGMIWNLSFALVAVARLPRDALRASKATRNRPT